MAVLKFGAIVTEGSGSLGGHTIQNSHGGSQLRTKPIPRGNPSASQLAIRSINQQLQAGWRALTPSQQKIWNDWSSVYGIMNAKGDKHTLSGHSLWMKYMYFYYSNSESLLWVNSFPLLLNLSWPQALIACQLSTECNLYWITFPYNTPPVAPENIKLWYKFPPDPTFCGGGTLYHRLVPYFPSEIAIQNDLKHNIFHSFHIFAEYMNGTETPTKKLTFTTIN